ncbi:MAG: rod shape-determining protein [Lachnospiraceae bacterium]|nr:rod shape-determining protein [Lachnospiraceae bacterium]
MQNGFGIDMGTGNLKIFDRSKGLVIAEKNTIAIVGKNRMYAYGDEAYSMYEKAPESINVSFPIVNGVIADFDNMQTMLLSMLDEKLSAHVKGADIVIAVPTDITEVEKKAFYDIFAKTKIKARCILLCEKPLADALGIGLDISKPTGIMTVDMGADTTEISVISLGGIVLSNLIPFGGNKLDESIVTYLKRKFNLIIGMKTAKELKETIGSAMPERKDQMTVVGRDVVSGLPIEMSLNSDIIYEAIMDDLTSISNSIRMILDKVPPELAKDIVHSGIYLTGGSSSIDRVSEFVKSITNIVVNIAPEGSLTAAMGLGKVITEEGCRRYGYGISSRIFR